MRKIIPLTILLFSAYSFSQTKLISYRSHSGNTSFFKEAVEKNLFDMGLSNMGEVPIRRVTNAQLDTVIYVSPNKSVMVTSEYCDTFPLMQYTDSLTSDSVFENYKIRGSRFWKAGKDTLYSHPLFSKKNKLDSIKHVLKHEYNFRNDIEDVIFIGFDNESKVSKEKKKKKGTITVGYKGGTDRRITPLGLLVILIGSFSLLLIVPRAMKLLDNYK